MTEEEVKIIDGLEEKLEAIIQRFPAGAFVKLSTRSPKDSAFRTASFVPALKREMQTFVNIEQAEAKARQQQAQNTTGEQTQQLKNPISVYSDEMKVNDVIAYTRAAIFALRVHNSLTPHLRKINCAR